MRDGKRFLYPPTWRALPGMWASRFAEVTNLNQDLTLLPVDFRMPPWQWRNAIESARCPDRTKSAGRTGDHDTTTDYGPLTTGPQQSASGQAGSCKLRRANPVSQKQTKGTKRSSTLCFLRCLLFKLLAHGLSR